MSLYVLGQSPAAGLVRKTKQIKLTSDMPQSKSSAPSGAEIMRLLDRYSAAVATKPTGDTKLRQDEPPKDAAPPVSQSSSKSSSSSSSATALQKGAVVKPAIHVSEDGSVVHAVNDPVAYAREFDRFAESVDVLERVTAKPIEVLIQFAGEWAKQFPKYPRGAFMITFAGFEALSKQQPTKNKAAQTFVWMPEQKLFPYFAESFRWSLNCYVPGTSVLIYLNSHTEDIDRAGYYGRVLVADGVNCAPLSTSCMVCVPSVHTTMWCSKCLWVTYCSREDQVTHYAAHKKVCKHYAALTGHKQHPIRRMRQMDASVDEWGIM